ncbi:MAG: D-alanyl-D-alanine carboxypeptidase/D-alanyl-D-alanine-endopeptidase [Bdellovibrionota bacterium]
MRHLLKTSGLVSLFLLLACQSTPQRVHVVEREQAASLPRALEQAFDSAITSEHLGYVIYDPETKSVVESHQATKEFIPASSHKIFATLAALNVLGPHYRFTTTLSRAGRVRSQVLDGDIYLKGMGDPFLTAADLMALAISLKGQGIKKVLGKLIYDDSFLPNASEIYSNPGFADAYNPGVSALSVDFNEMAVEWVANRDQDQLELYSIPSLPLYRLQPALDLKAQELTKFKYERPQAGSAVGTWLFSTGKLKENKRESLPVYDPSLHAAQLFVRFCEMNGIEFTLPTERGVEPKNAKRIAEHSSLELVRLAEMNLEHSNNLMSELLYLATARKLLGKAVRYQDAVSSVSNWIKSRFPGADWTNYVGDNGSGLSVTARVTPLQMLEVLKFSEKASYAGRSYLSLLPISGWKGTLRKRLSTPDTAFSVWAKTGTVNYSSALAGFLFSKSKRKYLFVVFVTDFPKRAAFDAISSRASEDDLEAAERWIKQARKTQDALISSWISKY